MPIHFDDLDVVAEAAGLNSALIVPCYMCPAVTVAVRLKKPFMQLHRSLLTSSPFGQYLNELQAVLQEAHVSTEVFRSYWYHQWFMCMWTAARRRKLREVAGDYDAVIVLGCESATETVREAVRSIRCKIIEGMETTGIMNATLRFHLPGSIFFADCKTVPISRNEKEWVSAGRKQSHILSVKFGSASCPEVTQYN